MRMFFSLALGRIARRISVPLSVSAMRARAHRSSMFFQFARHFSRDYIPKNMRLSRNSKRFAKKFEGCPLICYTCDEPKSMSTPKEFRDHNKAKHGDSRFFCGCKSGFPTKKRLQTHKDEDDCGYGSGSSAGSGTGSSADGSISGNDEDDEGISGEK